MARMRLVTFALALSIVWLPAARVESPIPTVEAAVAAQDAPSIGLRISGVDFGGETRYSVALAPSPDADLSRLLVEVFLPADAELLHATEASGRTQFLGATGNTLQWAASFASDDPIDAFSFFLRRPLSEPLSVTVSWGPDDAQVGSSLLPELVSASALEGDVVIPAEGEAVAGDTGARISAAAPAAAGAAVHLRRAGPEANPPDELGAFWWCAAVELTGLPSGAAAFVTVPARQALAPNAEIELFGPRDGNWSTLEQRGFVSPDGQFITFIHPGGLVIPGTSPTAQPSTSPVTANPNPGLGAGATAASVEVAPPTGADLRIVGVAFQPGVQAAVGTPLTASVTVRNVGTQASTAGMVLGATPPPGLELAQPLASQSSSDVTCTAQGSGASAPVGCVLPSLEDGQSRIVTLNYRAGSAGSPCLTASVQIDTQDPDPSNNSASSCLTITTAPTMDMRMRLQRLGDLIVNQNVNYAATLEVAQGTTSGPVTVNVSVDPGLRVISWTTPGWTCSGSATAPSKECTRSDPMTAPLPFPTIMVTAVATGCSGSLRHSAVSGSDAVMGNNQALLVETTPCPSWNLAVSATVDRLRLRDTQSISAVVRNGGRTASAGPLSFSLALPVELQTNVVAVGSGWSCQPPAAQSTSPVVRCTTSDTIPAGGSTTITVTGQPTVGQGRLAAIAAPPACPLAADLANTVFPDPPVDARGSAGGGGAPASATATKAVAFQIGVCG